MIREFGLNIVHKRKLTKMAQSDLLQLFIDYEDEQGKLSDETLCDQVTNFIMAGRDTT